MSQSHCDDRLPSFNYVPARADAWRMPGQLYLSQGQWGGAVESLRHAETWHALGDA